MAQIEFVIYLLITIILFVTFLTSNEKRFSGKINKLIYGIIILLFHISIWSFPQADMINYRNSMDYPFEMMLIHPYYFKEFFFWFSSSFIANLFGATDYVFYFWSLITFWAVLKIRKNLNLNDSYILLYYASFITLLGIENIYRQFVGTTFLILAVSYLINKKGKKSLLFFLAAIFSHNVMFLFFPLYFLSFRIFRENWKVVTVIILFVEALLFPLAMGTKSGAETGMSLSGVYLLAILMVFLPIIVAYYFKGLKIRAGDLQIFGFVFGTFIVSFIFLGGISERVGMICLMLIQPFALYIYDKQKTLNGILLRNYILLIYVIPSYLFGATLYFLENEKVFAH